MRPHGNTVGAGILALPGHAAKPGAPKKGRTAICPKLNQNACQLPLPWALIV
jgi:hypothetical protein